MSRFPPHPVAASRRWLRRALARLGLGTLLVLAVPLLVAFLWLRLFGLPGPAKARLMAAIERSHVFPFPVSVDRFLLDATGAVLAEHVTVFRDSERRSVMLKVDEVRVGIAWLSWWRGGGLIDGASISKADVRYPIGPETADFHDVNADVSFDGHDIRIENAQAHFRNLAMYLRGTIHNNGFPQSHPPTDEQWRARAAVWRSVRRVAEDISGEVPIEMQLEFEAATRDLGAGRADFTLEGRHLTWRSAPVDEISLHGTLNDGLVELADFKIGLERGDLTAYGEWNIEKRSAELQFTSSLDFTTLAPAFPGPLGRALDRLAFPAGPPGMTGRVLFDLHDGVRTDIQADLDWRDFTFNGTAFSQFSVPVAYDGKRLLIPGLKLAGAAGDVDLELFFDSTQTPASLKARVTSGLDPTILQGVFGEGMDRFLGSCSFAEGGPKIDATVTGSALGPADCAFAGKLAVGKFTYKNTAFDSAVSDFTFADSKLSLPNLEVHRPEGKAGGGIVYDFKNRAVELHNLAAQVNIPEVAPIMGPKFTEYTKPYRFARPPLVHANGRVDLQDQKKELETDLLVQVEAKTPMEWTLFHVPFTFDSPNGTLAFKNRRLTVEMKQCGFYDGSLTGTLDLDLRSNPAGYTTNLNLARVSFQKFMVRVFKYDKSTGQLAANLRLAGLIGNMASMNGGGEVKIEHGDIAQIPFLGSLTPLIPLLSAADAAHSNFTAAKGVIHTEDLHISSETLALIGHGDYSFLSDKLDLDMRVNANGPAAILLFPLSKIFEFHGTGPMKNVKWQPKNL